jgi:OmcA/MtrC family decaheme c-type cytochrome
MSGRFTKSAYAAAMTLALAACQQAPQLGPHVSAPPPKGASISIAGAEVDSARHVVVTVQIVRDGNALGLEAARALGPAFTLAALGTEPVSGLPAWRSLVLSGAETLEKLPVAGPGTPLVAVLESARQPGAETEGTWIEKGSGTFTYTFAAALPQEQSLSETMRVGVFLVGVPGTVLTTSTLDFVPDHSPLVGRELVVDAACETCHGVLRAHGNSRIGTKICVTCHTYQHADGQTVDPAAPASALPTTNPNPLELGRLVHRIHRGKSLPTFYAASSKDPAPQPPGATSPLPFLSSRNKLPVDLATNLPDPAWIGRRFAVVGELSRERVYAQVVSRADNGQPAKMLVEGATFPRDYRSCDACHTSDAAQLSAIDTEISRRTCHGCHADVWFEPPIPPDLESRPPDVFHLAHPGGPQPDDSKCKGCHVEGPDVIVPMKDAHVPPYRHGRYSKPVVEVDSVANLRPGFAPTIVFKVSDRDGPIRDLDSPAGTVAEPTSPVPRALTRLSISLAGPATPDIRGLGTATLPLSEQVPLDIASDADGRFSFTFPDTKKIPDGMDGSWIVVIEARRSKATTVFDATANRFAWPYTGETVTETADNSVVWVDTTTGVLSRGDAAPRRKIVDQQKCNACHLRLQFHGARNQIEWCVACHSPDKTDWSRRAKDLAGNVNLAGTYDGIEERSVHFKVLVHRLHTGGRSGPAELTALEPFVIYGHSGPTFHDSGEFPSDLQRCTLCHLEGTYRLESVPPDAVPTIANETPTIQHAATTGHSPDEPATPPISAACGGCHGTAYSAFHMARYTSDGKEQCAACHGVKGAESVDKVHALPIPVVEATP